MNRPGVTGPGDILRKGRIAQARKNPMAGVRMKKRMKRTSRKRKRTPEQGMEPESETARRRKKSVPKIDPEPPLHMATVVDGKRTRWLSGV